MRRSELRTMAEAVLTGRDGVGHDDPQALWEMLVDLGWPLVGIDESRGGQGGTLEDLTELATAVGYCTVDVPLLESAVGAWVASEVGQPPLPAPLVAPLGRAERLDLTADGAIAGRLRHVPGTGNDHIIVYLGGGLGMTALVDLTGPGVHATRRRNIAGEERLDLSFDNTPVVALQGAPPWSAVRDRATRLRLAATVGAMERAIDLTTTHVRVREQFGRPLAALPVVRSHLAAMAIGLATAQSALRVPSVERGLLAASIVVRRAADDVAAIAHQLHGAVGTTLEHDLHRATSRIWAWRDDPVTAHEAGAVLGDELLTSFQTTWELAVTG